MAIIKKITQPGNNNISSLDGKVSFEQGDNRFIARNVDGSAIGMGAIPGTDQFGFFALSPDGAVIMSIVGTTGLSLFDYDDNGNERMRIGKQPDNSYNVVTAKQGFGIPNVFT